MRKNGVNKELRIIDGGVCAPAGFRSNGVRAEILDAQKRDVALIVCDKRYPTACVRSQAKKKGAPLLVTEKHLKKSNGYAQAIVINSGIANVFMEDGEKLSESVCSLVGSSLQIDKEEVLIASTGRTDIPLRFEPFEKSIKNLCLGLQADAKHSVYAAEAIVTIEENPKELSFEFDLGDYPCRIGVIFKGNARVCPDMATFLAVITTDVNITQKMLQQALSSATKDVFNLMETDGLASPNDTVFLLASGKAGNYKISSADSEYKKFLYALEKVSFEICKRIMTDSGVGFLSCCITGAKSKQIARAVSKTLLARITKCLAQGQNLQVEDVVYAILASYPDCDLSTANVYIKGDGGTISLFDEGKPLSVTSNRLTNAFLGEETEFVVNLGEGNFSASSYGRNILFEKEK